MFVCSECGWAQPTGGRCNDGTELSPIGDDLLLGTTIGVYRVARLLGIGGMGRVYKAVHPQIGSRVAIKVLSRECSDRKDLVDRFFSEARAVNLIRHESIVNVLDLSVLPDGRPYIIMEYLDGAPLSAIIADAIDRGVPLPLGGLARLAVEVLDALASAHDKGIIHRDLKPDNVFITPSGRCKVLDFGIAKLRPELGGSATQTGSLLGTPHYMAPEQAAGRPVDTRADLYAMGVILYECATLCKPFVADSLFELLRKHIEAPVQPPAQLRADLSPALDSVIVTALGKLPDERFSTAQAMSQALQNATATLPPDQWAPVAPSNVAPVPQAWSGTPVSWQRPAPSPLAKAETVVSGQQVAQTQPVQRSNRGWFVLAGLAIVVGGAVAVALIVTGGDKASAGERPAPTNTKHVASDDDEVDKAIDRSIDHTMAKIDQEIDREFDRAARGSSATPEAPAKPDDVKPDKPAGKPDDLHTPDGWLIRHELAPYQGYDPKRVDVPTFIAFAVAEATKSMPEAKLIRADIDNVDPTGHADLTLASFASDTGYFDVRFVVPSRVPPEPNKPKPFGFEWKCEFRVIASPENIEIRGIEGFPCTEAAVRAPRCNPSAIWKKVKAQVPADKARADLLYRVLPTGQPGWDITVKGLVQERHGDDC